MSVTRRTLPEDLPFPSIPNVLVTAAFNGLLNVSLDVLCDARYILNHDEYVQAFCRRNGGCCVVVTCMHTCVAPWHRVQARAPAMPTRCCPGCQAFLHV